jgi:DNA polymerase-3 subunit delta
MLYMLWGDDEYSRGEALQEIKSQLGDSSLISVNTTLLEAGKMTLNELESCTQAAPFLTDKRLVIISGLLERYEVKTPAYRGKPSISSATKKDESQALIDCIQSLPKSTVLILTDNIEIKKNSLKENIIYKNLYNIAETRSFPLLKGPKLAQWIQTKVTQKGGRISRQATEILIGLIGGDLHTLNNEIIKLTAFTAGRLIEEKDVRSVVSAAKEADIYEMVDAIIDHRTDLAERTLQRLIKNGIAPAQILVLIARQIQYLIQINDLKSQKRSISEIQNIVGISNRFVWDKIFARSNKYTLDNLKLTYNKLLETDIIIKTGKLEADLALSILLAQLSSSV